MATGGSLATITGISNLNLPFISHYSKILVDLDELYKFMKTHHKESDRKDAPRRNNIRSEIRKYNDGILEENNTTFLTLSTILRYCHFHCDDFRICKEIVNEVAVTLFQKSDTPPPPPVSSVIEKTTFHLYKEIVNVDEIVFIGGQDIKPIELDESKILYINKSYKNSFTKIGWRKIQLFEFQFSFLEKERQKADYSTYFLSSVPERKWKFWETVKASLTLGEQLSKLNSTVCSIQRKRLSTSEAIEEISLRVDGLQHLPTILEKTISDAFQVYDIIYIQSVIVVDCCQICSHQPGIHVFLEVDDCPASLRLLREISMITKTCLKHHVLVQEIVYLRQGSLDKLCTNEGKARFSIRDKFLHKELEEHIISWDRVAEDDADGPNTSTEGLCPECYEPFSDWLDFPLSVAHQDLLRDWILFVPLPVRLLIEKLFLNAHSIKQAVNMQEFFSTKVARLTTLYDALLNTLNKNYFGLSQQMNTAELIVNYHNATSVFSITQAAGISMSLSAAENRLKKLANPERLYFQTYLKCHPLHYESLNDKSTEHHLVSLRECHLIFLVDNLVRIQRKSDPEHGSKKTLQLCTLPITIKGLPRNSKITDSWHTDNCDGSESCSCKNKTEITKDKVFNLFLSNTEDEQKQINLFKQETSGE